VPAALTDPNWFFSTLAQSAAAVIGIVGGFFVSRLLQQSATVESSKAHLLDDFVALRNRFHTSADGLRAFVGWTDEVLPQAREALGRGESTIEITHQVSFRGGAWSGGQAVAYAVSPEHLAELERERALGLELVPLLDAVVRLTNVAELRATTDAIEDSLESIPENARAQYRQLIAEADALARAADAHTAQAVPPYTRALLVLLAWLSVVGLMVPLGYLANGHNAASKDVLLGAFAVGITLLGLYLWNLAKEIRGAAQLILPEKLHVRRPV
jgi:hypothetical protein